MMKITKQILKDFLAERPAISIAAIGKEIGYKDGRYLADALKGKYEFTDAMSEKLLPVMEKYGFLKINISQ